ncbi:hypothetical protein BZG36_01234 [Bifiguratus adelaidae]|uniref:Cyclin-like domain-containing protein n=1 Tax=Bifiguratus adelaidae TaxID=1938954 RepID=A0A261Y5U7_9FUNG|nr:hypothetical protein BZG36_01234 [Bifiguratus adelaidae]
MPPNDTNGTTNGVEAPKPASLIESTSQYRHWRFSQRQLRDIRHASNVAAVERVKANVKEEQSAHDEEERPDQAVEYLNWDDERLLVRFYAQRLQEFCRVLKFSDTVRATSITFLKRFYLHNTVMDYHPKDILYACLFLATKVENEVMPLDDFASKLRIADVQSVLSMEFTVCQGIKFEFTIQHPIRPCRGFFLDMQHSTSDTKALREIYNAAHNLILSSLLTDLCFLYQAPQIALACLQKAASLQHSDIVDKYIETRLLNTSDTSASTEPGRLAKSDLQRVLKDIQEVLDKDENVSMDVARQLDRRLRICQNPAKNPESALYKKRQAEKEAAENEKRRQKAKTEERATVPVETVETAEGELPMAEL